ncbi:MAG: hypothetical protein ACTS77_00800, partial [Arsenophonus sp. NC-TX2-MAG3]
VSALNNGIIKANSVLNTQPYMINGHEIKDVAKPAMREKHYRSQRKGVILLHNNARPSHCSTNVKNQKQSGLGDTTASSPTAQVWHNLIFTYLVHSKTHYMAKSSRTTKR